MDNQRARAEGLARKGQVRSVTGATLALTRSIDPACARGVTAERSLVDPFVIRRSTMVTLIIIV